VSGEACTAITTTTATTSTTSSIVEKFGELQPPVLLWACPGLYRNTFNTTTTNSSSSSSSSNKGIYMVISIAISGDRNVIEKEAVKILEYKDLTIEIQRMWNVKTNVIPVIIGATETISKSFRKYLSIVSGKHEIRKVQKTAILGTAHIIRKVLM
jgi:hypothetical protein